MSVNYPQLYAVGVRSAFFTRFVFVLTIVEGVFSALVIYFIPYCTMRHAVQPDGRGVVDHKTFGVVVEAALTIAVTLRVGIVCFRVCEREKSFSCRRWIHATESCYSQR